ncbi:sensor histidine kinase [Pimelobacter simplex]|uniref:sensor histidine kinase n=1 Tax=Nocardioides simplex TaxID=2045 RepID=UPI003AAAD43D
MRDALGRLLPLLAAAYAAVALTDLLGDGSRSAGEVAVGVAGTLVLSATMVVAPRLPLTALLIAGATITVESATHADVAISPAATLVSIFVVGRLADRRRAVVGLVVAIVSVLGYYAFSPPGSPAELVSTLAAYGAFWGVAYAWARRDEEAERARRADRALLLAELRTQMARDLHDIIGHTLNVVVVHAGAARLSIHAAPETSRDLLRQIEDVGSDALADLDDAISMLGEASAEGDLRPTTVGIGDLPELVRRFAGSGVVVSLDLDPAAADLAAGRTGREVYRIVQEALTNALKHAPPCAAAVTVRRDAAAHLVVTVQDDGPGPGPGWTEGRGLGGIRERAARLGGTVEVGPVPEGGFRVLARIPRATGGSAS